MDRDAGPARSIILEHSRAFPDVLIGTPLLSGSTEQFEDRHTKACARMRAARKPLPTTRTYR